MDGISLFLVLMAAVLFPVVLFSNRNTGDRRAAVAWILLLEEGWYYDRGLTAFMGGPGRRIFDGIAWFDRTIVDGAVDGTGKGIRASAMRLRRSESGYVRNYALGIGVGAVLLLGWFVARGLIS